ncbi:hypothetical protein QR680_009941 [Steinernema hermaphroditum]|uniref:PAP-associated domain-containing protein n=1 Tax=Steinernema hermaphroditum TaxID=289476 RepID=A0AA39IM63_9BILA|nr:hypothetical protein QR680_009941 [Steinernema hermaphroditum]
MDVSEEEETYAQRLHVKPVEPKIFKKVFDEVDSFKRKFPKHLSSLDKRISKYCHRNAETSRDRNLKQKVLDRLKRVVRELFPEGRLIPGGSTVTRLSVKRSDYDLCLYVPNKAGDYRGDRQFVLSTLQHLYDELIVNPPRMLAFCRLIGSTVPIIRLYLSDDYHDMELDINCNVSYQFHTNHLVRHYVHFDERVKPLVLSIKKWAKAVNILDSQCGRLNSFSFVMMTIHFLQSVCSPPILPNLSELFPKSFDPSIDLVFAKKRSHRHCVPLRKKLVKNRRSLGELFLAFIAYFSEFDWDKDAIVIRSGGLTQRNTPGDEESCVMCIEEPYGHFSAARTVWDLTERSTIEETFRSHAETIFKKGGKELSKLLKM